MSCGVLRAPWCSSSTSSSPNIIIQKMPAQHHRRLFISDLKLKNPTKLRCNSSSSTPGGPAGENESKSVLDAFFLGKALAEAVNERLESAVGEFLSTVGRLQAEQQKQVQDFQDEVLERAKKAKEIAAREVIEAQGVIPKPSTDIVSAAVDDTDYVTIITPEISTNSSTSKTNGVDADRGPNDDDSILGVIPIDD